MHGQGEAIAVRQVGPEMLAEALGVVQRLVTIPGIWGGGGGSAGPGAYGGVLLL